MFNTDVMNTNANLGGGEALVALIHVSSILEALTVDVSNNVMDVDQMEALVSSSAVISTSQQSTLKVNNPNDMLGIRIPIDFANFYQIVQSTSGTESYTEGFTLIASILHKIVSNTVSERT